jgi:predicted metal-dependent phosphoesterase TrpH
MLNYQKLFEPFTVNGATLDRTIAWLQKQTKADQSIVDQVVAETMDRIDKGETFQAPCPCGCEGTNAHTHIEHYMLSEIKKIVKKADEARAELINARQKKLVEDQLKRLSNFDKEYNKMINGTWSQKNLPTFRKWVGLK